MAVMDESARISRLRLAMGPSSAVYLFCAAMMVAALALFLGTGEILFLALPVPFLAPVLPSAFASFRLACSPASTAVLEQDGIRLGDDILPYESVQWAELAGPAARPHVCFICAANAHPPFRALPLARSASRLPGVYDPRHLDFVQEINLRVRMAGNPGIR
jgi:hypothetical protein